ncbi:MAG TPA: glycoside hydrolase family 15 protein [Steroidobacteraceae bacterium]|nr:glycoside hydrolase family 15 protein [Steroidobacteraceae bacterium]
MPNTRPLDLAVVGNCEVAALIDPRGTVVWMCLPHPDGDPVFNALLRPTLGDSRQGVFSVEMADLAIARQDYVRNTPIVETVLEAADGSRLRITDFCPRFESRGRVFRPMSLVRIVEPLAGRPRVRLHLTPEQAYGTSAGVIDGGSHHLRFEAHNCRYRITTNGSLRQLTESTLTVLDAPLTFVLSRDEALQEAPEAVARSWLDETLHYWQSWSRGLAIPYEWQDEVIRAAITLKLCTVEDSGAVLAALTTSIPESANSGRNWDYRYCWLRDAYFTVQALNRLGTTRTMEGYLHYIDRVVACAGDAALQPVYRIAGDAALEERIVDSLEGFLGMGPVRAGNQAAEQIQHDVYGAVILALAQLFFDRRLVNPGDENLFRELEKLGERAFRMFDQPDAGPWEFRGMARAHTYSAAMSWAGCDRLARIAERLGLQKEMKQWRERADGMRKSLLERAWNPERRALVASLDGTTDLDASLLLLPELGLIDGKDPRFIDTVETIGRELREGDLVFRYRHADDFGRPEVAFTVCAFWYVNALASAGRVEEAREQFEALLKRRNHLGLLSEDVDPVDGQLWGNYPQTYSMVGIIGCALRLSRSWDAAL